MATIHWSLPRSEPPPHTSVTATSIVACITAILFLLYMLSLIWSFHNSQKSPIPTNKPSGQKIQSFAPFVYAFMVITALAEAATSSWLLVQYRIHGNYPNMLTRTGAIILLSSACWTCLTAGLLTHIFLHPAHRSHPVSSVGSQGLWLLITWMLWIAGAVVVNGALPSLITKGNCLSIVYCGQLRTLFALAVLEIVTFSGSLAVLTFLIWSSARNGHRIHTPQ
ncbi:uncharacterized protein EV420DRAFT_1495095 [Desarmillaria tabescens]|uniref:MARVEL domain-containing protein n=1 Tax=Armillaria tabescens TaxID=1929756 RepID=A0AA39NPY5_ARMTA|nr:uncharacterized protein EV420DRAFT_1495095 [Desarmillaria tabescens]KAK0469535.1 hypothetical protein EV420DRAFT_1495095 [Desarmillaria tabescens]